MKPKTIKELKDFIDEVYKKTLLDGKEIEEVIVFDNTSKPFSKPIIEFSCNELGEVFFFT
jgi:hypothetical protein